jgi:hypothetical protein
MNRRQFLATTAAASVAGCTGLAASSHHVAGDDAWADTTRETAADGEGFRGTLTLEPGAYVGRKATVTGTNAGIAVGVFEVMDGRLDIFVFKQSELEAFQAGDDVAFIKSLTATGVTEPTKLMSRAAAGDYAVAIANSPAYGSEPDGEAVADIVIAVGGF